LLLIFLFFFIFRVAFVEAKSCELRLLILYALYAFTPVLFSQELARILWLEQLGFLLLLLTPPLLLFLPPSSFLTPGLLFSLLL